MAGIQEYLAKQVQGIQNELGELSAQELDLLTQNNWLELKNAARTFLEATYNIEIVNKLKQSKIKSILATKDLPSEYKIQNFTQEFIKEKELAREFYKNLFAFDKALSRYFNELPKRGVIVMVGADGAPFTYEMSLEDMASIAEREGRIQIYNPGTEKSVEGQVGSDLKEDLDHIEHGRAAFMGVNARLEAFYSQRATKTVVNAKGEEVQQEYQRQGGLLMWKTGGEWEIAAIANQGVVSEAYVSFLFTKHQSSQDRLYGLDIGSKPYYSHALIENFYKYYMSGVTNLAAIVEEDVIGDYAQYAVKAKKAALATPAQHIRVASTIIAATDRINPGTLKEMIKNTFKKNSALAPLIQGKIKDALTGEIVKSASSLQKVRKKMISKGWFSVEVNMSDDFINIIQQVIEKG